jgi:hypothetical protein
VVRAKGLLNTGNMCYMCVVLQVLMFTKPFYHLLDELQACCPQDGTSSSAFLLDSILLFFQEYQAVRDLHAAPGRGWLSYPASMPHETITHMHTTPPRPNHMQNPSPPSTCMTR